MKKKKIISIVGTRPEFIKLAALYGEIEKKFNHIIIHTGQHYDREMDRAFFEEFNLPTPDFNLKTGSGSFAQQTAKMMLGCEKVLLSENPSAVLVFGDTNSTLCGAIAAAEHNIPIVHIEAGMRSFDRSMPEEINRIICDHLSSLLLCSSKYAVLCLQKEGISKDVFYTGDINYDIFLKTKIDSNIISRLNLKEKEFYFLTIHRQENTNNLVRLARILRTLSNLSYTIVFPVHPRTEKMLSKLDINKNNFLCTKPLKFSESLALQKEAKVVITDSGGIQKEAYWLSVPCVTLRLSTEWVETVESGWNHLVGASEGLILKYSTNPEIPTQHPNYYGEGDAAAKMVSIISDFLL